MDLHAALGDVAPQDASLPLPRGPSYDQAGQPVAVGVEAFQGRALTDPAQLRRAHLGPPAALGTRCPMHRRKKQTRGGQTWSHQPAPDVRCRSSHLCYLLPYLLYGIIGPCVSLLFGRIPGHESSRAASGQAAPGLSQPRNAKPHTCLQPDRTSDQAQGPDTEATGAVSAGQHRDRLFLPQHHRHDAPTPPEAQLRFPADALAFLDPHDLSS